MKRRWASSASPTEPASISPMQYNGLHRLTWSSSLLAGIIVCLIGSAWAPASAQFLSRDFRQLWTNEVFENYGPGGYRDYDFGEENRRFDLFGDLIVDGVDII